MEHLTYCRICPATCGLVVDVEDGRVTHVAGDLDHPLTHGFTCPKGRRIGDFVQDPSRFRSSQRRVGPGRYEDVDALVAVEEIAARLKDIIATHGPDAVAFFTGTQASMSSLTNPFGFAWWRTIGSRKNFSSMTIDQSAKWVGEGRLGRWAAGMQRFTDSDVWMLVGTNPPVSMQGGIFTGFPIHDGLRRLQQEKRRGLKLIVVDPRRTEVAAYADLHLPVIPGTDAILFAALLNVILTRGWVDPEFCARWVHRLDALRDAVAPITPDVAAAACGVPAADIEAAAELFGRAERGMATSGTGPDMSPWANLAEHLIQVTNVVCGRYPREDDALPGEAVLGSAKALPAEAVGPARTWESGYRSRFGYGLLQGQLPTPTLPDEILDPAPDQVRALIVSGANPAAAIPDQAKAVRALSALDLLVTIDPFPSETARLADYVIAPVLHLERPDTTRAYESLLDRPFAQWTEPVLAPPPGVIDDWEFFVRLAGAMGHTLTVAGREYPPGAPLPSTAEVLASFSARARIPLDEVRRHPRGAFFDELEPARAAAPRPDTTARFDVMPDDVAAELRDARAEAESRAPGLQLVVRRSKDVINSLGRRLPGLTRRPYNPCHVHPDDLAALGAADGTPVTITSDHGTIRAVAHADPTMRLGVVSMTHAFGDLPSDEEDPMTQGANTNRLLSIDEDLQAISAMPRMSGVAVEIAVAAPLATARS